MRLRRPSARLLPPAAAGLLLLVTVAVVAMALSRFPSSGAGLVGQGISELAPATDPEPAVAVEPVAVPPAPPLVRRRLTAAHRLESGRGQPRLGSLAGQGFTPFGTASG